MQDRVTGIMMGCGFLASHLLSFITPLIDHLVFVDMEKIDQVNYDNYIILKNYSNKKKVTAFSALAQMISPIATTPVHTRVRDTNHYMELIGQFNPDIVFVSFDNVRSRIIARDCAQMKGVQTIFMGATENYCYVDWGESIILPETEEEIQRAEEQMSKIRDVCSRIEFRGLGAFTASAAYQAFITWRNTGEKLGFMINTEDNEVKVATLRR